ncbi:MAG: thiamine pyrophosphate-dependent enzyme [Planctomycetota bacterium]
MAVSRQQVIHENFLAALRELEGRAPSIPLPDGVTAELAREIFESQLTSRLIDFEARAMKAREEGFYTIGSAGHEGNAAVAAALRPDDLCFLHYRSGAFMMQRSRQVAGTTPIFDTLLSLSASSEDPASGGRHKVWGSAELNVPPQTSTIASHLPKAVGAAFALGRSAPLHHELTVGPDAIVVASFGDASLNHSTAVGAINSALWARHQRLPLPLLMVCEDNQIGISVKTPRGWIESQYANRPGLAYFHADGRDLGDAILGARRAIEYCRTKRAPTFLHLETERLMGHAGSDVEQTYRTLAEIEDVERRDPLIRSAAWLVARGVMTAGEIRARHDELEERIRAASREAAARPKLTTAEAVVAALAPCDLVAVEAEASRPAPPAARIKAFGSEAALPERSARPRHLAMLINWALLDLMAKYDDMLVFGEDVAKKGGVYHVTTKLYERFGAGRCFNTLLDEQTILGVAIGAAHLGYLPSPEIQYLAYLVHASDQLRGEACSLQFFSNDRFRNPMVMRVASLGYQKGFGGHFHNDNGFAFLREMPGLVIACPSRGDDAVGMLRTAFALAKTQGRVVAFMEPIALYMTKDLHEEGDEAWSFRYPEEGEAVPLGEPRIYEDGGDEDLTVVTYGNGVPMSLRVAGRLRAEGVRTRVVDLRWLLPLGEDLVVAEAVRTGRLLVVDEGRRTAGIGEQISAVVAERAERPVRIARVAGDDCYVPLAAAANLVLVSEAEIERAARALLEVPVA